MIQKHKLLIPIKQTITLKERTIFLHMAKKIRQMQAVHTWFLPA